MTLPSSASEGCEEKGFLRVWVERAVGADLGEPFLRKGVGERTVHEPDTLFELALLVLGRSLQRALEIVEHGHEFLHEALVGARGQLLLVARHPLAVVVELGLQPLERVEVLVTLLDQRGYLVLEDRLLGCLAGLFGVLLAHFSSTTSYSASSTTSSSEGSPDPPAPEAPSCAEVCA